MAAGRQADKVSQFGDAASSLGICRYTRKGLIAAALLTPIHHDPLVRLAHNPKDGSS